MRVGPLIGAVMVQAMGGHPPGGRILETANRDDRKSVLKPQRTAKAAVAEQSMITEVDPGSTEDIDPDHRQRDAGPAEEPGIERQQCQQVIAAHRKRVAPIDASINCTDRSRQGFRPVNRETCLSAARVLHQ